MGTVVKLVPGDKVVLDHNRISVLARRSGRLEAERIVMDCVEEIAERLARTERHYRAEELGHIAPEANAVAEIAMDIGLISLARICHDLALTAEREDITSLKAVWGRLVRIGDQSLAQLWELPVLSV